MSVSSWFKKLLLENGGYETLPTRVQVSIRTHLDRSEQLIGWVQLGIVATFGLLYAVSPKTHMNELWEAPVPIALTLYLFFTLVRLIASYRVSLPDWYLGLSGLVDIALLMSLIWSFHIQYQQPPAFYLKTPTMLYVFIFIALRALRFEPRHVFRTGMAAACGWLLMVFYATFAHTIRPPVTRNYVEYLTSNSVLFGAEFDKVITILMVTAILTYAIIRGRRMMLESITEGIARRDLSDFFSPEVAERITDGEDKLKAGHGDTCMATIVNVDIRGFTKLAVDLSPNDLMKLLGSYQSRILKVIERHGGSVDKFLGDGIMVTFGASRQSAQFAKNAILAIQDSMQAIDDWNMERISYGYEPVAVGFSAATGQIVLGVVGVSTRLEYTVIGDTVNLSAKLEKHNRIEASCALCDMATINLAKEQGWAPKGDLDIRKNCYVAGTSDPMPLCVLN